MSATIDIKNVPEVKRFLKNKDKAIESQIQKVMWDAGAFLQGEVKLSIAGHKDEPTSVDTGRFLNSVEFMATKDAAAIFSDIPYAKFLEHGTSKTGARKHFGNSKDRNKNKVINMIKKGLRSI